MASRSAPLVAQKKRRHISTQTKKGISSYLLLHWAIILTFAAQEDRGISKVTGRRERLQDKDESSQVNPHDSRESTEQEACLH